MITSMFSPAQSFLNFPVYPLSLSFQFCLLVTFSHLTAQIPSEPNPPPILFILQRLTRSKLPSMKTIPLTSTLTFSTINCPKSTITLHNSFLHLRLAVTIFLGPKYLRSTHLDQEHCLFLLVDTCDTHFLSTIFQ